jgi:hypothetical protein
VIEWYGVGHDQAGTSVSFSCDGSRGYTRFGGNMILASQS